jgi:hypothetical protein
MGGLQRESPRSPYVFISERGPPFTSAGFRKTVARLGEAAGFRFGVHPHMLRHACGYKLANQSTDTRTLRAYLGHKNIAHTVRYTELSATRFKGLWKDRSKSPPQPSSSPPGRAFLFGPLTGPDRYVAALAARPSSNQQNPKSPSPIGSTGVRLELFVTDAKHCLGSEMTDNC